MTEVRADVAGGTITVVSANPMETAGRKETEMKRDDRPHGPEPELVVYGTGWCPDVRRSRALLDEAGIAYTYVDLDEDEAATELVRQLQRGQRRVPTLLWPDGGFLVEPTDDQLRAHLDAAGRCPPPAATQDSRAPATPVTSTRRS